MGFLLAIFAAMLWGLAYALDHQVVKSVPPTTMLTLSAGINLVLLLPVLLYRNEVPLLWSLPRESFGQILLATLAVVIASFCTLVSIKLIGAPLASSLEISYPLFTTLFLLVLFKEPSNWWTILGALCILTGSIILVWKG